jgi:hypothetical protein
LRLHPDKGGDPELFKEVTHAFVAFINVPMSETYPMSATKYFQTQQNAVYMIHEEKPASLNRAGWEEWIHRCGKLCHTNFPALNFQYPRIFSANYLVVAGLAVDPSSEAEADHPVVSEKQKTSSIASTRLWKTSTRAKPLNLP